MRVWLQHPTVAPKDFGSVAKVSFSGVCAFHFSLWKVVPSLDVPTSDTNWFGAPVSLCVVSISDTNIFLLFKTIEEETLIIYSPNLSIFISHFEYFWSSGWPVSILLLDPHWGFDSLGVQEHKKPNYQLTTDDLEFCLSSEHCQHQYSLKLEVCMSLSWQEDFGMGASKRKHPHVSSLYTSPWWVYLPWTLRLTSSPQQGMGPGWKMPEYHIRSQVHWHNSNIKDYFFSKIALKTKRAWIWLSLLQRQVEICNLCKCCN